MPPDPLYTRGDYVLIEKLFVIEDSLRAKMLESPIVARVAEIEGILRWVTLMS